MVDYTLINGITFLVGVGFLSTGYYLVARSREDVVLFLTMGLIGAGLIVVALVPNIFEYVALALGLEWKARAMLVISNLTLFVLTALMFRRLSKLYDRVSQLNEELSLLKAELEDRDE